MYEVSEKWYGILLWDASCKVADMEHLKPFLVEVITLANEAEW